jgi:DUF4097 and DUF4098 domain-containing protein YvlB
MLGWMTRAAHASTTVAEERPAATEELGVTVEVTCGSVQVRGDDVVKVKVSGTVDDPDSLSVSTSPGHVSISVDARFPGKSCADLVVTVPKAAAVDGETISASLRVDGVSGSLDLQTTSGPIDVTGSGCGVSAQSISGPVTVRGAIKRASVSTVSSPILVDQVVGPVDVESVSGTVRVAGGAPLPAISASTVSAPLTVASALLPEAHVHLETHSGPIVFALPADASARIRSSTMSGPISSAFGAVRPGDEATVVLGAGSADVRLETFSGPIAISRLER